MLKDLQMELKTKVALSVLMGLSAFAMVACIVKTIQFKVLATRDDFTYTVSSFVIWFTVENYVVIIAASIPTLRPLILKIMKMHANRRSRSSSAQNPSLPPCTHGQSWITRPNPVRLHSTRKSIERWDVEPPYIHQKPKKPPPPGTIRKTVSIYISSESDCENMEFQNLGVGVHTRISAGGRSRNTTAEDEGWRITRTSRGSRPAPGIKADDVGVDVDLERQ
jgi:hypothetical protein